MSNRSSPEGSAAPLVLFADLLPICGPASETPDAGPDQGERVYLRELGSRLRARVPTALYSSTRESSDMIEHVETNRLVGLELAARLWRQRPRAIVYLYPVTVGALVRAKLLQVFGRGAPVAIIALASHPLGRVGRAFGRLLRPAAVFVASEAERMKLQSLGSVVDTLPVGVDVHRFRPSEPGEKQRLRASWGLPVDAAIALHVGHLVKARNLHVLTALAARESITAVMVASHVRDSDSQRLLAELRRGGVVVLEGYQPRLEELYRAADCYVFPSDVWGGGIEMPLSVLEAMASDLPVASTSFGALPERFRGTDGIRFATNDDELVEKVVLQIRERPHTRHLVEQHSWDAVAEHVLSRLGYPQRPDVAVEARS